MLRGQPDRSAPGVSEVKQADRARAPRTIMRSRATFERRVTGPSSPPSATVLTITTSWAGSRASTSATGSSRSSASWERRECRRRGSNAGSARAMARGPPVHRASGRGAEWPARAPEAGSPARSRAPRPAWRAHGAKGLERLRLAAAPVEGEHLQPAQALPERVRGHERIDLPQHGGVVAGGQLRLHATLDGEQPQLVEARGHVLQEGLTDEIPERGARPLAQGLPEQARRLGGPALLQRAAPYVGEPLEAVQVEGVVTDAYQVSRPRVSMASRPRAFRRCET